MLTIIDTTCVQINYFYNYSQVNLTCHLIINVCSHICDYCNHICDYNVDITKWNCKCDYSLWLLHVWMKKYESAHFFIQYWMDT